jgi:hypothetical protein
MHGPNDLEKAIRYEVADSIDRALLAWEDGDSDRFNHWIHDAIARNRFLDEHVRVDLWAAQYEPDYLRSLMPERRLLSGRDRFPFTSTSTPSMTTQSLTPDRVAGKQPLDIHKTLTLSTAHLAGLDALECGDLDVVHYPMTSGGLVYIGNGEELHLLPAWLHALAVFGREQGCDYLWFDSDGFCLEGFPQFDEMGNLIKEEAQ